MASTIREQIISAYQTRLSVIRTAAGYNSDMGANVYRSAANIDSDITDAVVLWPKTEDVIREHYGQYNATMALRVEGFSAFDPTSALTADHPSVIQESLLGDIIKCMTDLDVIVSSKVDDIFYTTGGPAEMPGDQDTRVAVFAEFEVKYRFNIGDPYNQ